MVDSQVRDRDQKFYAGSVHYFDGENRRQIERHLEVVNSYIYPITGYLDAVAARRDGNIRFVELGAGTCLTSLSLKKRYPKASFTCADISLARMQELIGKSAELVGTDGGGIALAESDMSNRLPFGDRQFDVVVFDGSLHHSCNIWRTLEECRRILVPDGAIAALREQYLAPVTAGYALRRLLQTEEVRSGVAENAYLRDQYSYYFKASGFQPRFLSVTPTWLWRLLAPLNGIVFSKWSVWAPLNR
jgi:ubiquinone/menaquinone biosynthesis C-methylase UbiE